MAAHNYALVEGDRVVNVIVLDDTTDPAEFAQALGGDLIPLDDHHGGRWGIGWRIGADGIPVSPPPPPVLTVDGVPSADGTTGATARIRWPEHPDLTPPSEVVFTLNGAASAPVQVTNRSATLEVTASGSGPITVEAAGQTVRVDVP